MGKRRYPDLLSPAFSLPLPSVSKNDSLQINPGTPRPTIYKWLFQLDDEPNLYIENGWKSPFPSMEINGWPWGSRINGNDQDDQGAHSIALHWAPFQSQALRSPFQREIFVGGPWAMGDGAPIRSLQMGLKWGRYKWPYK